MNEHETICNHKVAIYLVNEYRILVKGIKQRLSGHELNLVSKRKSRAARNLATFFDLLLLSFFVSKPSLYYAKLVNQRSLVSSKLS